MERYVYVDCPCKIAPKHKEKLPIDGIPKVALGGTDSKTVKRFKYKCTKSKHLCSIDVDIRTMKIVNTSCTGCENLGGYASAE